MKEVFYDWLGYNTEIFYFLNHVSNAWVFPQFLRCLSWFFNIENFAVYYMTLCGLGYQHVFARSKVKLNTLPAEAVVRKDDFWLIYNRLVYIGICYAVFGLTYAALKFSVNLPRPFCSLPIGTFETIIDTTNERCMSSFPSSHAGLALMATLLAWRYLGTCGRLCAIVVTLMAALARVALAMHYPADVLYSYLIVLTVLCISRAVFRLFENNLIKYVGELIFKF